MCANSYAASLQVDGCYVRYDATGFIGAENTVVYRKCSSSTIEH
jgi:hypothetical protein